VAKNGSSPIYNDDFLIELSKISVGLDAVSSSQRQTNGWRDLCEDVEYEVSSETVQGFSSLGIIQEIFLFCLIIPKIINLCRIYILGVKYVSVVSTT
jgi:hypothetical protein